MREIKGQTASGPCLAEGSAVWSLWLYLQVQTTSARQHSSEVAQQHSNQEMLQRGNERQRERVKIRGLLTSQSLPEPWLCLPPDPRCPPQTGPQGPSPPWRHCLVHLLWLQVL